MKKTKYVFPAFTFYDRTGIQNYLEKQAENGWMLEKMGGFSWKFRRMQPQKLHFAVTYFPSASAFDPGPSEQQEMFQEFCAHSGWQLAASSAQLQIFYNEKENPIPIETDPVIELENIHKAAKKTFLPAYFMMLPTGLIMFSTILSQWQYSPLEALSSNTSYFNILCGVVLILMCATELIGYFRWYRQAKRTAVEDGEFVATKGGRTFQITLVIIEIIALVWLIVSYADGKMAAMMLGSLVLVVGICAISLGATGLMKRMKVSAKVNSMVTFILTIVLTLVGVGAGLAGMIIGINKWWPDHAQTYEYRGFSMNVYHDDLPLTIEDLMETDYDGYSYHWTKKQESIFVGMYEASQRPRLDALENPDLSYTIVEVKAAFLYDFCLNSLLKENQGSRSEDIYGNITYDTYRQIDAAPWGADAVYREYNGVNAHDQFVLCYDNRIIEFEPDWEMTSEQMAAVGRIFG